MPSGAREAQVLLPVADSSPAGAGNMKRCCRCDHVRPISEFCKDHGSYKSTCKLCDKAVRDANPEKHRSACARWYQRNREEYRAKRRAEYALRKDEFAAKRAALPIDQRRRAKRAVHLKRKYGISLEQFDSMAEAQGGVCAICQRHPGKGGFCVDHDHATGKVRQLLCRNCNSLIGMAEDNKDLLWSAIRYLAKHGKRSS